MHVRRERTERLVLVAPDGTSTELATATRVAGAVDSQDDLAVSPDARYLAWSTPDDDRLHLRDADGHERTLARYGQRMRFSPDGKWLAAITLVGRGDWQKLVVWELATGRVQSLLTARGLGRFEWVSGGIAIAELDELVYAPLAGDHRTVFEPTSTERLERFTAAANGDRLVLALATRRGLTLRSLDLAHSDRVRELGHLPGTSVENSEQSPDGKRVVLVTDVGLYAVDGNEAPHEISSKRDVHSLWFAPDGRLAYASPVGATVLDGKHARRIESHEPIDMLRFEKGSRRILLVSGNELRAWDAATGRQTVLAATKDERLLGADRYAGGVVVWTTRDGRLPPHRIVRVLRVGSDGTSRELERTEGDSAVAATSSVGFMTSTDGRTVAYREPAGGGFHVHAANGTERTIAGSRAMLSPTGAQILVGRWSEAPLTTVSWSLVDTATGTERTLAGAPQTDANADVGFALDGKSLAISGYEHDQTELVIFDVAGKELTRLAEKSMSFAWTPRGLLVTGDRGLAMVSPAGDVRSVLDESVEPGIANVLTSTKSARVLVCFRAGSTGASKYAGLLSLDLDAPARPVMLDIPNCWNRNLWLSPDGEQVVFSGNTAYKLDTDDLNVRSVSGGVTRGLGEAYNNTVNGVVFDGRGRIAFLSHRGVRSVDGPHEQLFETDGPIVALHATQRSPLVFAVDREVIGWSPDKGTKTVLARAPEGQRILAVAQTPDGFLLATVE